MPAAVLRLVDTGGVQIEVTSITNGSVVVEFNLLITADVDVREVLAAFLLAFQNASLLEVVGGDTFIQGRWGPGPGDSPCSGREAERARLLLSFEDASSQAPRREVNAGSREDPKPSYRCCVLSETLGAGNARLEAVQTPRDGLPSRGPRPSLGLLGAHVTGPGTHPSLSGATLPPKHSF